MRTGLLALALLMAAPAGAFEPEGTWHVLVHYKDSATSKPDQERWEDRIWVFARKGDRLTWTDYPIVVFDDQSGRFERLGGNRASRILHFWEPNPGQQAEIAAGLEYNSRGSKQKTLRRSGDRDWTSARSGGGYQSARFITYTETWSIEGLPDAPVFQRDDSLAGGTAEEVEGRTRYETTDFREGGDVLVGRFERDGTRSGSFRITRSGAASVVKGSGKTQSERVREVFFENAARTMMIEEDDAEEALRQRIEAGSVTDEDRRAVRKRFEGFLEEQYRAQGQDPRAFRADIQRLARKMTDAYLDEGKSVEEIGELIRNGQMRP